jgi:hypothetical protein
MNNASWTRRQFIRMGAVAGTGAAGKFTMLRAELLWASDRLYSHARADHNPLS